jgi:splicing factor 3B subunit 3
VLRLPLNLDEEILQDSVAYKNLNDIGRLNGAPYKFEPICNFYVGDMITTMTKTSLISTANEVIVYATAMGGIGAFYPFETREDVDFFMHLELFLR